MGKITVDFDDLRKVCKYHRGSYNRCGKWDTEPKCCEKNCFVKHKVSKIEIEIEKLISKMYPKAKKYYRVISSYYAICQHELGGVKLYDGENGIAYPPEFKRETVKMNELRINIDSTMYVGQCSCGRVYFRGNDKISFSGEDELNEFMFEMNN